MPAVNVTNPTQTQVAVSPQGTTAVGTLTEPIQPPPTTPNQTAVADPGKNWKVLAGYVEQPEGPTPPIEVPPSGITPGVTPPSPVEPTTPTPTPPAPTPPGPTPTPTPSGGTPSGGSTPSPLIAEPVTSTPERPALVADPVVRDPLIPEPVTPTPEITPEPTPQPTPTPTPDPVIPSTPEVITPPSRTTSIPNTSYVDNSIDFSKYAVPAALGVATVGAAIKVGQELSDDKDKKEEEEVTYEG